MTTWRICGIFVGTNCDGDVDGDFIGDLVRGFGDF
jgi:hypothetical protein